MRPCCTLLNVSESLPQKRVVFLSQQFLGDYEERRLSLDLLKIVLVWEHLLRPLDRTVALVHLVLQAALLGLPLHFRAVRIGKEEEAVAKLN